MAKRSPTQKSAPQPPAKKAAAKAPPVRGPTKAVGKTKKKPVRLECDFRAFNALQDGASAHVFFKGADAPEHGAVIEIAATDDPGSETLKCRVLQITEAGTPPLPPDVGVVTVAFVPPEQIGSRLFKTLHGHLLQLQASFVRSAAHKLPGSKGRLREMAVSDFLASWMPKRYSPLTNSFLSHDSAGVLNNEIDLVLYDSHAGPQWPLDAENSNWFLAWDHVKVVLEVKSTLDAEEWGKATRNMDEIERFAGKADTNCPPRILFAYRVDDAFRDEFESNLLASQPFDLIVVLQGQAFASPNDIKLISAFETGLSPEQARNDQRAVEADLRDFIGLGSQSFRRLANKSEHALMAMIYWCTNACAGSDMTRSLLSALGRSGEVRPLFADDGSSCSTEALAKPNEPKKHTKEFVEMQSDFDPDNPFADEG
ncbi:DUF6602 domain-containing protein [Aquabacterium sp.]|uniref:DUF6602 domain-containing protein n=1 Tax=Aquabacterium sp. TaxID=1872578 RepID=UPI0027B97F84|nr:DUF6602 domain-containing protein [Aquabacterium sp.]